MNLNKKVRIVRILGKENIIKHDTELLDDFANWLKEKGIWGSKEFTRIIQMYKDELKAEVEE